MTSVTSDQAVLIAEEITQNDLDNVPRLITLLHVFRSSVGDPAGEIVMSEVLRSLAVKCDRLDSLIDSIVSDYIAHLKPPNESIAA